MRVRGHDLNILSSQVRSEGIKVLDGAYEPVFRLLTEDERIECLDIAAGHRHPEAVDRATRMGILSRVLVKLNGQALELDGPEKDMVREHLVKTKGRSPEYAVLVDPKETFLTWQQARFILGDRFPEYVIDALWIAWNDWYTEYVLGIVDEVKKKRAREASGSPTFGSASPSDASPTIPTSGST